MKKLFLLFLIIYSFLLFAQTPDWQWVTQAGGIDFDEGYAIAIDDNGSSYVTGWFEDTATFGSYSLTSSGNYSTDIFVAKMDANGIWLWATQAGGNGNDNGYGIAIDDAGNSYVTGRFSDTATFGSYSLTSSGTWDIFVAKMDANGNWLWATKAGGSSSDKGHGIGIDDNGNSYVTGHFYETATFGSYSLTSSGGADIFVAKMDINGNWLWATKAGGSSSDKGHGIGIDDNGNSYVTGYFMDTATFGSYSLISSGGDDIFVAKMDPNGNWLWATKAGGSSPFDYGYAITIDNNGNSYVTGCFWFNATFGSYSLYSSGEDDIFVAKMDTNGNWLWATKAGGSGSDKSYGIAIDDNGRSYVTGFFSDTATFSSISLTSSGSDDIFVAKLSAPGYWLWATKAGGSDEDEGYAIARDDNGNFYITGFFSDTATFSSISLTSSGGDDIFVAKLGNYTSGENEIISTKMELSNYPNPFNPTTTINYSLKENSKVSLKIYNIKGQKVKQLFNDQLSAGEHSVIWNGTDNNGKSVSSGIYFYKLRTANFEKTKKMILMK